MPVQSVSACDARIAEITPPHDFRPRTGKEPGQKRVLVELDSRGATNLWPWGTGLDSPYTRGFVLTKDQAAQLADKLKELSESMDG